MKGSSQLALRLIPAQELGRISIQQDPISKGILQHLSDVLETSVPFLRTLDQDLRPETDFTVCKMNRKGWGGGPQLFCDVHLLKNKGKKHDRHCEC